MTDAQIEAAARELCKLRGMDPDGRGEYPWVPTIPAWEQFAKEVRAFAQVGTAIASVIAKPRARKTKATK